MTQAAPLSSAPPGPAEVRVPVPEVQVRIPLFLKLVLMAAVLAIIPLVVVGLLVVDVNAEAVRGLNRTAQTLAIDDLAITIEAALADAQDDLAMTGSLLANPNLDDTTRLALMQAIVERQASIDHVGIYDADGTRLVVVEESARAGIALPDVLPAELRTRAGNAGRVFGELSSEPPDVRILMVVAVHHEDRVTGFVAARVPLTAVQDQVNALARTFSGTPDSVFIVDQSFRLVAHRDLERALAREEVRTGILADVTADAIGPTLSITGPTEAPDGTPLLSTMSGIPRMPWVVVVQVPQSVAYASLHQMRTLIVEVFVAAMVLALLVGLLMAAAIGRPITALTRFAGLLANRQFGERVEVRTWDELAVLGGALNRAASDLAESEVKIRHEVAVRTDLGRYVPEQLVDRIMKREADMRLGGERRAITVMFADVVGFTPLAEKLPPEVTVTILNELFSILTEIVFKHGGTVDKFVGDCVMAFWNAPSDQADHVRRALEAAEDMQGWLESGNERWKARYGVTIELAIGVHTGEAIVGNIGSEKRMEYTAIGNVVNLAARLEAVARPSQILVTDAVRAAAGEGFETVDADLHRLSGWAEPVRLWELRP